ncbi:MAG: hypothetical protein GF383_03755 [Candidatus Lokiarchaeota archaeon]|nr:hypothetical protein [Candidatus Lokiarchaeota archaeon]MBD3338810.1 hypothetical protein [Candidatus Lokiarchaeota archaeon]
MNNKKKFKTTYLKLKFYNLGGYWGYAVMMIEDSYGKRKVRWAKCKTTASFPKTEKKNWEEVPPEEIENLKQVNKINIKSTEEFEACSSEILEFLNELE